MPATGPPIEAVPVTGSPAVPATAPPIEAVPATGPPAVPATAPRKVIRVYCETANERPNFVKTYADMPLDGDF